MKSLIRIENPFSERPWAGSLLFGAGLAGIAVMLGACGGGYVDGGGGAVVVDADVYGPGYGGPIGYGHPYYHDDSHFVGPPHQAWHGAAPHAAPARSGGGGGGGDHDRK
jgi:hypothetical protein